MLAVVNALGRVLVVFSAAYLLPIIAALICGDGTGTPFLVTGVLSAAVGLGLAAATRRGARELKPRDGFLLVTLG